MKQLTNPNKNHITITDKGILLLFTKIFLQFLNLRDMKTMALLFIIKVSTRNVVIKNLSTLIILTTLFLSYTNTSNAQQANVWYFHQRIGLNFNTSPPSVLTNGSTVTPTASPGMEGEGVASICDALGNILFYTDGVTVYDRTHAIMANGTGLMGHQSSAQSAIIIPKPGSATNYYIVTAPLTNTTTGIRYSEVDMSIGNGQVLTANKNTLISPSIRMMEAICGMPHDNGTDFWLITHEGAGSNTYYKHLVTNSGISTGSPQSIGYTVGSGGSDIGMLKSNSCYNKIAISYHSSDVIEILNFDNLTGALSSPITITNIPGGDGVYGLEFSPKGDYLYATGLYVKKLYQFDISSGDAATIESSIFHLGDGETSALRLAALQLGPDGKIYAANHTWGPYNSSTPTYIGVINNPDTYGAGANWVNNAITIPAIEIPLYSGVYTGVKHGLPTLLKSLVANTLNISNTSATCINQLINFSYLFSGYISGTVSWDFGDGSTSTLNNPTHSYSAAGTYTVTLTVTDNCARTTIKQKTITIIDSKPSISWVCSGTSVIFTGSTPGIGNTGYLWYGGSSFTEYKSNASSYTYNPATIPASFMVYGTNTTTTAGYLSPGNGYPNVTNCNYVDFDALSPFFLKSVDVKPSNWDGGCNGTAQPVTFTLRKGATIYATRTITINCSAGLQTIILDMGVPMETGLRLETSVGFYYVLNGEASTYPWTNSGIVNATGAGAMSPKGPFSNWKILTPANCSATRVDLTSINCTLPVVFVSFDVKYNNGNVELNWTTSAETNNDQFEIVRSIDGKHFETIGTVKSNGTTSSLSQYHFIDPNPYSGTSYYSIRQIDLDGNHSYFPIRSVTSTASNSIYVFPNPSMGQYTIQSESNEVIDLIEVYNEIGQLIFAKYPKVRATSDIINLENVNPGIYHLLITTTEKVYHEKVIKF